MKRVLTALVLFGANLSGCAGGKIDLANHRASAEDAIERCILSGTDCYASEATDADTLLRLRETALRRCLSELDNLEHNISDGTETWSMRCIVDNFTATFDASSDMGRGEEWRDPVVTYSFAEDQ